MNGIQVTTFHNRSTEPLNYRIFSRPQSIKQARRPDFYNYTRLPMTRWVKLSLNFELLVNRVLYFLLGQRLFNNKIFCTTCIQETCIRIQETTMLHNKLNKIKMN